MQANNLDMMNSGTFPENAIIINQKKVNLDLEFKVKNSEE